MYSQFVQLVGDADFIFNGEGDTFCLGTIPESSIINFYVTHI
jgi:hypothetical protein